MAINFKALTNLVSLVVPFFKGKKFNMTKARYILLFIIIFMIASYLGIDLSGLDAMLPLLNEVMSEG